MAVHRVCDRCGKAVETGLLPKQLVRKGLFDKHYDLCPECYAEFDEWMKEKVDEPQNNECKDEWTKKFNITGMVKFKLTEHGKAIYHREFEKYCPGSPHFEEDGLVKLQLNRFIQIFGPYIMNRPDRVLEKYELYMYEGHFGGLEDRYGC